jgi:hypothetical protein
MTATKGKEKKERKRTLPAGHPRAGYVSPDLSFVDGVETFSDEEQEARDEMIAEHEEEVEAVEDAEDEAAKEEEEEKAKEQEEAEKSAKKADAPASSTSSSAAKS